MIDWLEQSRIWWIGRLMIPGRMRRAACVGRREHRPERIDLGRRMVCPHCGTW